MTNPSNTPTPEETKDITVNDLFPRTYICFDDLDGQDRLLTIERWTTEEMYNRSKNAWEIKPVIYFKKAKKGLVLNIGIANTIKSLHGKVLNGWIGKQIILYPTTEHIKSERREVVRVRAYLPKPVEAASAHDALIAPPITTQENKS